MSEEQRAASSSTGEPTGEHPVEESENEAPTVDEVLAAVDALEERPLEEHVGVFERAHEQLRRALDPPSERS